MTFFSLTFTSNIRFAWGDTEKYYYIIPLYHFLLLSSFMGLDGLVPSACVYPFGKDGNPHTWEIEGMRSVAVFHCRAQRLSRMSRGNPAKKQSPIDPCMQCVHGCSFLPGADAHWRKEPSHLIAPSLFLSFFSCTIERPCVCVCDLLFDTKQVPFSILYPKLSIPYYIKERTPVDIVFLSLPGDRYIIFTHRDTHAIVICFPVSYFLFFYFRFPGGKITLNVQSCGGHGVRESNDTIFIR